MGAWASGAHVLARGSPLSLIQPFFSHTEHGGKTRAVITALGVGGMKIYFIKQGSSERKRERCKMVLLRRVLAGQWGAEHYTRWWYRVVLLLMPLLGTKVS